MPNIPSRVPQTASYGLSNFFTPILVEIGNAGGMEIFLKQQLSMRNGIYMYNGILTNRMLGEQFGITSRSLDLLLAGFNM